MPLYYALCMCVCVFNTPNPVFTPEVIICEHLSPQSLLFSLSLTGSEGEEAIRLHPNVCVGECVYI